MASGIYKIINTVNGKYYVGSSNDIDGVRGRWYEHRNDLRANRHRNAHLQNAWNKYGENAFVFTIVEELPTEQLLDAEQSYLNKVSRDTSYNIGIVAAAPCRGIKRREETKRRISETRKLRGCWKGNKNANHNPTMYYWYNIESNLPDTGSQYHMRTTYNLNHGALSALTRGERETHHGWTLKGRV
jgi:group I intron endonuclease